MSTFKAQESKNLAQLANIRGKIHGLTGLNLVQPNRRFIHEGDVDKVSATSGIINTRHLFLFNDLLIYGSVKHKGTLYEYSDHIFIKNLSLKDLSFKSSSKIGFQLVRNDETKQRDYIMLCRSLEDKNTWIQHIQQAIDESKNPTVSEGQVTESPGNSPSVARNKKGSKDSSDGMLKAAIVGNVDAISQHIREGSDISAHDPETGQTMLHKLAHSGHAPLLHLLLESYTGNATNLVNSKDFSGATALHYAANSGQTECQKVLLGYGANPALLDDDQASPLHYACRLGSLEAIVQLLPTASSVVFKKDSQGLTPASYAAFHGHKEALTALLDHMRGAIVSQSTSSQETSPSPSAVRFNSPALASDFRSLLVEPLHFASMTNHIDCVDVVLDSIGKLEQEGVEDSSSTKKRVGINTADRQGLSAAHHAALNGHVEILSRLHKRGADIYAKDSTGGTILHAACTGGSIDCLKYLIKAYGDKNIITSVDSGGMTSLHRAVVAGHLCIVWELLNSGICSEEVVNLKDNRGQTALHVASESKWGGCALLLINVGKADVTIRDEDGYTPLHVAMKHGAKEIVSYIANTEHDITKRDGETLIRLGKQHPDCIKIIAQVTGLSTDIKETTVVRSASVSSISDLSESSNIDSTEISSDSDSDDETTDDDDEENTTFRSEVKQRVIEIWQGVRSDQLLSNLFLETVRGLYRLPQDGDFGVTYWTYVNNFVQKVSQNPATDRGLLALRRDLNLDFLENHSRLGRNPSASMLDLRSALNSSTDDSEKSEKPLLQRTVATRRIPLGTQTGPRPPLLSRGSGSLSSITPSSISQYSLDAPRVLTSSQSSLDVSKTITRSPSPSQSPSASALQSTAATSSPPSLLREGSPGKVSSTSRRLLAPTVSFSSLSALIPDAEDNANSAPKSSGVKNDKPDNTRVKAETKRPDSPSGSARPVENSPDKPSERKVRSAKAEHSHHRDKESTSSSSSSSSSPSSSSSSSSQRTPKTTGDSESDKPHRSGSKMKFATDPPATDKPEESSAKVKKSASSLKLSRSESEKSHSKKERIRENANPHNENSSKSSVVDPKESSQEWEDMWKNKRKSDPSFWEAAISTPSAPLTAERNDISNSGGVNKDGERSAGDRKNTDITAAIEGLLAETVEDTHPAEDIPPARPQLSRTVSTRRATKRLVFLDKKREEQIAAVLHGHDVSPKELKEAIQKADCSVLIPGLLSALAPILPSKKEATICAEHHYPSMETLPDLSDRELAQLFVVEMAAAPRVHQRVEAMMCRSTFEVKVAMIHKVIKMHFTLCSQLTTNYRLRDVIEVLLSLAAAIPSEPSKPETILLDVIEKLSETIPEFLEIIKPIASNAGKADTADISIAWTELQYGVSVCKQEISKCHANDPLIALLTDLVAEAEPEMEQLQKEMDVWEAITDKIGMNLVDLAPLLCLPSESVEQRGDPISTMLSVFSLIVKTIKGAEEQEREQQEQELEAASKSEGKKHKTGKKKRKHHHPNSASPFGRDKLKGEKILQPELTPLRVTFNAYKDFCAKTSKVKRKTYTFLKNQKSLTGTEMNVDA